MTTASLDGAQSTHRGVRYHLLLMGASSGDGLAKEVALCQWF